MKTDHVTISNPTFERLITENKFIGNYRIVSTLKEHLNTKVVHALYFKSFWFKRCIIKSVKIKEASTDGHNALKRLSWQFKVHQQLHPFLPIARPIEEFELDDHHYLVLEYHDGKNLQESLDQVYADQNYKGLSDYKKSLLLTWLLNALHTIDRLHNLGYVHRDISASNFIVSKSGLNLVDMENTWKIIAGDGHEPAFPCWTKGYSSPQQIHNSSPTTKDDIYSLGCLMINILTHIHPKTLNLKNLGSVARILSNNLEYADLTDLLLKCIDPIATRRPDILDIKHGLTTYRDLIKKT